MRIAKQTYVGNLKKERSFFFSHGEFVVHVVVGLTTRDRSRTCLEGVVDLGQLIDCQGFQFDCFAPP